MKKNWNWNNPITWKQSILASCISIVIMAVCYGITCLNARETIESIRQTSEELDKMLKDVE